LRDDAVSSDLERCAALVRARTKGGLEAWAGEMEKHYSPGRTWESLAHGLLGLCQLGDVLDVGCGDGAVAQMLAPRCKSITLLDSNPHMMRAAVQRLKGVPNVRFKEGNLIEEILPAHRFDEVLLLNVLTEIMSPHFAIAECQRLLRRHGRLVITTLNAHTHNEVKTQWQHMNKGFEPAALEQLLIDAGFTVEQCAVTSREKRPPHLQIITAIAHV